jgi:hypothetical protein
MLYGMHETWSKVVSGIGHYRMEIASKKEMLKTWQKSNEPLT